MKTIAVFACIALFAAATAFVTDEDSSEGLLEAQQAIAAMKKKGATEQDCKDLAKTTCKEVYSEIRTDQRLVNRQSNGVGCNRLGVRSVKSAKRNLQTQHRHWIRWRKQIVIVRRTRVSIASRSFGSLRRGKCGFVFTSGSYRNAKAKYLHAVKLERVFRGRFSEARKGLARARASQKRAWSMCRCSVMRNSMSIWRRVTNRNKRAKQFKALQKCKLMQCVLSGINVKLPRCKARLPGLRKKRLYRAVYTNYRSGVCRHHKEKHHFSHKEKRHGHGHHLINYGKNGADWGRTENKLCGIGKRQSPVDVKSKKAAKSCKSLKKKGFCGDAIKFKYGSTKIKSVVNNGHTVQVNFAAGNSFSVCGETFPLVQLHFHSKSENEIDGRRTAMEMHLVHVNKKYKLPYAVIGVWLQPGRSQKLSGIERLFAGAAKNCYHKHCKNVPGKMNPMDFLPRSKAYYRFLGGFTTPPCTEGVRWFELKKKGRVSSKTVNTFRRVMEFSKGKRSPSGNSHDYREIQKTNRRAMCTGRL